VPSPLVGESAMLIGGEGEKNGKDINVSEEQDIRKLLSDILVS